MSLPISHADILLTSLFAIGLFQSLWLSVVLVRKGFAPSIVRSSIICMLSIWILVWPAYENTNVVLYSLSLLLLPIAWVSIANRRGEHAFARHLKLCWHTLPSQTQQPSPWILIWVTLGICAYLFTLAPELGFGLALSFSLAWQAARLIDISGKGKRLGLLKNPQQTLFGHILFVILTSLVCAWSLQLYHSIEWYHFFIVTMIVGLVGSMIRTLVATGWNLPLTYLGMACILWLL